MFKKILIANRGESAAPRRLRRRLMSAQRT